MPVILILALSVLAVAIYRRMQTVNATEDPVNSDIGKTEIQLTAERVASQFSQGDISALQKAEIERFSKLATVAGTGVAAALASTTSLTLATAGPIGAAIAGVIVAIAALKGTAHLVANQWVTGVQNQFDAALSKIVDAKDESIRTGLATKASVGNARIAVTRLWAQYQGIAETFAAKDNDNRLVIDQSYCWYIAKNCRKGVDPRFPEGLLNRILNDMDKQIATLP